MDGECTGHTGGPGTGDAPGIDHIHLAGLGGGIVNGEAVGDLHGKGFVLLHETVGIAAANGLQKILTLS